MDFVKEWWFLIAFTIGIFGGLYKMSQTLNETLLNLKFEITRLSESLSDSKADRVRLHSRIDETEKEIDKHDTRISILEDWRRGK
jgi:septal ring factor EnvC (AmiA/AmiB activator)